MRRTTQCLLAPLLALSLTWTPYAIGGTPPQNPANYYYTNGEGPTVYEMVFDITVARPLLLIATGAGTGLFLLSLPFSLLGNNAGQAGEMLVVEPAKNAFVRCLGCIAAK